MIAGVHLLINRTKLGLAIRAVAQDGETARTMGINFTFVILITSRSARASRPSRA